LLPLMQLRNCLPEILEWQLLQGSSADGQLYVRGPICRLCVCGHCSMLQLPTHTSQSMCLYAGASTSCVASGRLLPGANMPLPGHRDDTRCLRICQAAANSTQPGMQARSNDQGNAKPRGQGTAVGIADDLESRLREWSLPLSMGRRQASNGSWRMLAAAATPIAATLPSPGTSSFVQMPSGPVNSTAPAATIAASDDGSDRQRQQLTATLAAQEPLRGCSAVIFSLLPHGVLHNCTSRDLVLEDSQSSAWSAAALAGSKTAFSTGNPAAPPDQVCARSSVTSFA
jgi:hypothetical protein